MKRITNTLNRAFIGAYKSVGLLILAAILFGLASYLVINVFYLFNRSWAAPMILSPSSERVIALNSELASQSLQREVLSAERLTVQVELRHLDRQIAVHERFQEDFEEAMITDEEAVRSELAILEDVYHQYRRNEREIRDARSAFADMTRERSQDELDAHLIDRQTWLERNYLLSQVATADIQLEQSQAELGTQTRGLELRMSALQSLRNNVLHDRTALGEGQQPVAAEGEQIVLSYEMIQMHREYQTAQIEVERLRDARFPLEQQLAALDDAISDYDRLLAEIRNSAYLRAFEESLTIAFVPYDNLDAAEPGEPVYVCHVGLFICTEVGSVIQVLDGEVAGRHPIHNRDIRGLMVELELDDPDAAEHTTLHIGGKPFLL